MPKIVGIYIDGVICTLEMAGSAQHIHTYIVDAGVIAASK